MILCLFENTIFASYFPVTCRLLAVEEERLRKEDEERQLEEEIRQREEELDRLQKEALERAEKEILHELDLSLMQAREVRLVFLVLFFSVGCSWVVFVHLCLCYKPWLLC